MVFHYFNLKSFEVLDNGHQGNFFRVWYVVNLWPHPLVKS